MRSLSILIVIILIFWINIGLSQELDETQAPQKVQQLLQDLRQEIQDKGYSFTVGFNPALNYDLSQLCGLKEPANWWQKAKDLNISKLRPGMLRALEEEEVMLPAQWDWRDQNGVTSVRDQEACGSCWAFGTIASFESLLLIKQNLLTDLSEQFLVSCNEQGWGCNGGWWAHDMLVDPGAVEEEDFPYVAEDVPCNGPYEYTYQLDGWAYVDGEDKVPGDEKIKQAIYDYGPVCAAVYVGSAFQSYTGGVFNKDETPQDGIFSCCAPTAKVNHAIFLVGWNDDKQAWILKNSWGTGWGENGYMLIKYGISNVGYAAVIVY